MSFEVLLPLAWEPDTEAALCERLGAVLKGATDPKLIRGQFEVKGVTLGHVAPQLRLEGLEATRLENVKVELSLSYRDTAEDGLKIMIGGAEVALTGTESFDATFEHNMLWYPFEVTLYNLRMQARIVVEAVTRSHCYRTAHRPPPPSALHELQVGRLRAARVPPRSVSPTSDPDPPPAPLTSQALREQQQRQQVPRPARQTPHPTSFRGSAAHRGTSFGLAYASRRVHYPKYPRAHDMSRVTTPSHAPLTPSQSFPSRVSSLRPVSSALSLDGGSGSSFGAPAAPSSPASVTTNDMRSPDRRSSMQTFSNPPLPYQKAQQQQQQQQQETFAAPPPPPPWYAAHLARHQRRGELPGVGGLELRVGFPSVPEVDFSLRTNFRSVKGADEQVKAILKSLLRPKLEETLRGAVVHLPGGTVELGHMDPSSHPSQLPHPPSAVAASAAGAASHSSTPEDPI